MPMADPSHRMPEELLAAEGFAEPEDGLWHDSEREIGARIDATDVTIGWIDVTWNGPAVPEPCLRGTQRIVSEHLGVVY
jgi:hypothetical protein